MASALFVVMVAAYGAGAAMALLAGAGPAARVLPAVAAIVGAAGGLLLGLQALATGAIWALGVPEVVSVAGGLLFRLDALGAVFLILVSMVAAPAALYGVGYSAAYEGRYSLRWLGGLPALQQVVQPVVLGQRSLTGGYTEAMKTGLIVLGVIVLIVVGGIGWAIGINNQLVAQEQAVNEKWAQVQNVYQRRADLIPNLVETVKGYAAQERTVLEEVTKARASVAGIKATPELVNDPEAFRKFQAAQQELSGALARLLVTVERYPDLKSNQNFLTLQSQLEGTENRIAVERMRYSEAVRDYNTRLRLFPGSLVASLRGFKEKAYFEAAPGSQDAPKVKF